MNQLVVGRQDAKNDDTKHDRLYTKEKRFRPLNQEEPQIVVDPEDKTTNELQSENFASDHGVKYIIQYLLLL
jgi:hypothetical protein